MAHTAEETLEKAKIAYTDQAHEVQPTHPDEDIEWWIADASHEVFAIGVWSDNTTMSFRPYTP